MEAAEQLLESQKKVWSSGDWPKFAALVQDLSDEIVEAIGVGDGQDFLDVATGSGNAAFAAARRGARVTGLDLVPELIDVARERFSEAGLEAELLVGNAEELPFRDDAFDRVTSIFGVMFAPRPRLAAAELVRVARPGAKVAITAWTPDGLNGRLLKTLGAHMPPPPEGFVPPVMWGDEDYVRDLFSGPGLEVETEERMATFEYESVEGWMDYMEQNLGPITAAKAMLEPEGKWEAARADLEALESGANEADDGSMRSRAEYLLTTVTVAG